jgi:hypothetical protein
MRVRVCQEPTKSTTGRFRLPERLMIETHISPLGFARCFTLSGRIGDRTGGTAGNPHHGAHGRTTEDHGSDAGRSDDKAAETIFEARGVEVHKQTNTKIAHPKVGEKLGVMSWEQGGDGFDFQDD